MAWILLKNPLLLVVKILKKKLFKSPRVLVFCALEKLINEKNPTIGFLVLWKKNYLKLHARFSLKIFLTPMIGPWRLLFIEFIFYPCKNYFKNFRLFVVSSLEKNYFKNLRLLFVLSLKKLFIKSLIIVCIILAFFFRNQRLLVCLFWKKKYLKNLPFIGRFILGSLFFFFLTHHFLGALFLGEKYWDIHDY